MCCTPCPADERRVVGEALFVNFGPHLTSVHPDDSEIYADIMLGFVAAYCPNVAELRTHRMDAIAPAIDRYKRLPLDRRPNVPRPFGQLRALEFIAPRPRLRLPTCRPPSCRACGACR